MYVSNNVQSNMFLYISIKTYLLLLRLSRISEEMQAIEVELQNMTEIRRKCDIEVNNARNNRRLSSKQLEYLRTTNVRLRAKRDELQELMNSKIDPTNEEAKTKHEIEVRFSYNLLTQFQIIVFTFHKKKKTEWIKSNSSRDKTTNSKSYTTNKEGNLNRKFTVYCVELLVCQHRGDRLGYFG